jgi:hypothetical protein
MTHFLLLVFTITLIPSMLMGRTAILQFASLPKSSGTEPIELLTGEGKSITIAAPQQEISKPYRVDQRKEWTVGKFEKAADGTRKFTEYGKVKALATRHQLIILIRKGATNADGFKLIVAANGLVQFGGGSFLLVNGSDQHIGGKLGAEEFTLAPDEHSVAKPKAKQGKRFWHVTLSYRKEEKVKPFLNTNWPVNEGARGLICFYTDLKNSRLRMHTFLDFVK